MDEDLPLVLRTRAGDLEAFDALVMKHQSAIAAMLHHFSANHADLEDLVQDTFVKAWSALDRWEPERPFIHWLKRIAARTGLEYCRKRRTSPLARSVSDLQESIAPYSAEADRASLEAREILAHLPPDDRALLTLLHLQGLSIAEAADHFGWSRPNTKIKAFRARHRLRKLLNRHGYSLD
ncbi:MAG: sigma-70 family RNA polymerase sigma factor [Luteolibacter sp.]